MRNQFASRDRRAADKERGERLQGPREIQRADSWAREREFRLPFRRATGKCESKPRSFPRRVGYAQDRFVESIRKIPGARGNIRPPLPALLASPCFQGDRRAHADPREPREFPPLDKRARKSWDSTRSSRRVLSRSGDALREPAPDGSYRGANSCALQTCGRKNSIEFIPRRRGSDRPSCDLTVCQGFC